MLITLAKSRSIGRLIAEQEPRFKEVIAAHSPCPIGTQRPRQSAFAALATSILSQQLSTKAAATITRRVEVLAGGRLEPTAISKLSTSKLRGAGCSNTKARSILELAEAVTSGQLSLRSLHTLSDEMVIEKLTPFHGIGKWTVEMFLIFQLNRLDIWPVGDLGVRRGWEKVQKLNVEITISELSEAGAPFAPYRSHLAWYCWRAHSLYA
jgi:DNA-3-methyladenine glycosylase II